MTFDIPQDDTARRLAALAELTRTSEELYPLQVQHLQRWIYGCVEQVRRFRIEVDFANWVIRYVVDVPDSVWPHPNLLRGLARSVRDLLRGEYDLEVKTAQWEFQDKAPHPEQRTRSRVQPLMQRGVLAKTLSAKPLPSSPTGNVAPGSTFSKAR